MAITIEDGTIVPGAESYTEITDVDTYLFSTNAQIPTAWSAAPEADKEGMLRRATRYLDGKYRTLWIGSRYDATQALEWPRTGAMTRDGFTLAVTAIPDELKWATAELCVRLLSGELTPDLSDTRKVKSERLRAEPLEIQNVYDMTGSSHTIYETIDMMLGRILRSTKPSGISIFTLERA